MTATELREKSVDELREELVAVKREQFNLRMQHATGQEVKTHLVREARRNAARIKTVIAEKERA
ncbi:MULTISPECIES: 50S ribosomal protein L29 [Guyparkeria]|uniref:50S ribosomal protein L29 n=1 Tax=Guyparkeria TaxID=2035712 RepID=UPI0007334DFB|nr:MULTISPECIES: 50S ribosomal protein L29 [Guyparkeria]KTG17219.1 50S ribosomal protein L29 [Guyparkeria sp. XI15]MCL7744689.1 50S ribosomal protein L29 [Guyparkeria hydrothermalis]OAE87189.1 50S ribosomal protein L29 [Guyparkeria sp. WRN-7]